MRRQQTGRYGGGCSAASEKGEDGNKARGRGEVLGGGVEIPNEEGEEEGVRWYHMQLRAKGPQKK